MWFLQPGKFSCWFFVQQTHHHLQNTVLVSYFIKHPPLICLKFILYTHTSQFHFIPYHTTLQLFFMCLPHMTATPFYSSLNGQAYLRAWAHSRHSKCSLNKKINRHDAYLTNWFIKLSKIYFLMENYEEWHLTQTVISLGNKCISEVLQIA